MIKLNEVFLCWMLLKLNLSDGLVILILQCIMSVRFRILINGESSTPFSPTRGLRQRKSLSPYLFMLCAKDFSSMINQAVAQRKWNGLAMGKDAPLLSHLFFIFLFFFFVDDCLLFMQDTLESPQILHFVIRKYEQASGRKINAIKSSIYFSKLVSDRRKLTVASSLGMKISNGEGKKQQLCQLDQIKVIYGSRTKNGAAYRLVEL